MDGWTIDIDAAGDPSTADDEFLYHLDDFEAALEPYGAAVAGASREGRYGARFSLDTTSTDPIEVLGHGLTVFRGAAETAGLPSWSVVHCEILTYAEDDAQQAEQDQDAEG